MIHLSRQHYGDYFARIGLYCTLTLWPVLSFSSALMQVFFWSSFVCFVFCSILNQRVSLFTDKICLILLAIFFTAVVISMGVSDHPKQSFRGLIKVFRQIAVLGVVLYFLRDAATHIKVKFVVLGAFLLLIADGAWQYFTGVDFLRGFASQPASSGMRLSASFEHYGKLAAYLCAVLPVVLGYATASFKAGWRRWECFIWALLAVSGLVLFFLTRSRGAFIALFLSFVVMLFFRRSWKISGILFFAAIVFVASLPKSMVIHLDADHQEQSVVERLELWHRAWDVIQAKPLTGTGINTYAVAHQKYDTRKNWRVQNYYAHNGYLQTAAEIGVPGALALILFFLRWLWIHRPSLADRSVQAEVRWGLWSGCLAFMIFCMGDTAMHSLQPVAAFWFVMGLLGAFSSANSDGK